VLYGLVARDDLPPPPAYPFKAPKMTWERLAATYPKIDFWGENTLAALCARKGPNAPDNPNGYLSCPVFAYGYTHTTIQDQIRDYIEDNMRDCLGNDLYNLNADVVGNITVQVVYGDSDIALYADYPLRIEGKMLQQNYTTMLPVRLKRIYELAYRIIEEDIHDPAFHKGLDFKALDGCAFGTGTTRCWDSSLRVYVLRSRHGHDDILRIEDDASMMDDHAFVFQTAMENRRPMLEYIYSPLNNTMADTIDLFGYVGDVVRISPRGIDPDEDSLSFNYSLWAETTNTSYNTHLGCDARNVTDPMCITNLATAPHRWTTSDVYAQGDYCNGRFASAQCAEIELSPADRGVHSVRVSVSDEEGLEDYQIVRILVNETT
jgi:hypothetical protein